MKWSMGVWRSSLMDRRACVLLLVACLLAMISAGCDNEAPSDDSSPVAFPQHDYPLGVDRGGDYYAVQLVLRDGCMIIEVSSNPNNAPWPARLAIWPSSFSLEQDSGAGAGD